MRMRHNKDVLFIYFVLVGGGVGGQETCIKLSVCGGIISFI